MTISTKLADASSAMLVAQARAADLWNILTVLNMAIMFEPEGLDADQRAGLEAVIGHAEGLARDQMNRVNAANSAAKQLIEASA